MIKAVPGVLATLAVLAGSPALAEGTASAATFAGTSTPLASLDIDGDGITAFTSIYSGKDPRFGRFTGTIVSESGEVSGFCGPNAVFFGYTSFVAVIHYERGDSVYLRAEADAGGTCFDFIEGTLTTRLELTVTGGTGRFANASGIFLNQTTGSTLASDAAGNPVVVGFSGSYSAHLRGVGRGNSRRE